MILKRKYFDVNLEVINVKVHLFSVSQEKLVGRVVKLDLTRITKGKNCEAKFKIFKENEMLIGKIFSFSILSSYIRRIIGNETDIVEDSFSCEAKDTLFRVKPFLITRKKVHRSIRNALRNESRKFLSEFLKKDIRSNIFEAVISGVLQKALSKHLKKIYPLAVCELRVLEVEKKK